MSNDGGTGSRAGTCVGNCPRDEYQRNETDSKLMECTDTLGVKRMVFFIFCPVFCATLFPSRRIGNPSHRGVERGKLFGQVVRLRAKTW